MQKELNESKFRISLDFSMAKRSLVSGIHKLQAMVKKHIIHITELLTLLIPFFAFGQSDTIVKNDNFIVYLTDSRRHADTLNRIDNKGKQGKWIEYDTSMVYNISITVYNDEQVNSNSKINNTEPYCSYKIKWTGYYFDNQKQGLWIDSYKLEDTRKEFFYKDNILQSPILYYLSGHLDTYAQYDIKTKLWKILRFDNFGKTVQEFYEKDIQFIIDF